MNYAQPQFFFKKNLICTFPQGYQLEPLLGPLGFSAAVASSSLLSGLAYVLSALGAESATGDPSYATECVLGLSGALFALKVACLGAAKSLL